MQQIPTTQYVLKKINFKNSMFMVVRLFSNTNKIYIFVNIKPQAVKKLCFTLVLCIRYTIKT